MLGHIKKIKEFWPVIALLAVAFVGAPVHAQVTEAESVTMRASIEALD